MPRFRRFLRLGLYLGLAAAVLGIATVGVLYWLIAPRLPDVHALRQVELQEPLTVYSADGRLMALFGETRRYPVRIQDVPERVRQAFIATEDARFYDHPGVDWRGVARAVWLLAVSDRDRVPGGSTITQQVARQFFLSTEYSYTRKLTEIFLALKMERELSKDEIFELYLNKSFFGNRAYGIAAAAEFYYGKTLEQLTLAEAAMLASVPKHPSSGNPIANPARALDRRNYVLARMLDEGFIGSEEMRAAQAEPNRAHPHEPPVQLEAPYAAEMVRQAAVERYGAEALTGGYRVTTTLDSASQEAATLALRTTLLEYDRRHGWRGAEDKVVVGPDDTPAAWAQHLAGRQTIAGLVAGLVVEADAESALVYLADGQTAELALDAVEWAAPYLDENRRGPRPRSVDEVLAAGDIIRLTRGEEGEWLLAQVPKVQGALVSLEPEDGAVRALVGGFSFSRSRFNRAIQAQRQPGSSFKPFIYAAAFERGFTPASIVLDAPVVFHDRSTGVTWRPQNDNETFAGPMRLREAMVTSRNLVSVRILDAIGVSYARRYLEGFGFEPESLPPNLSLALGTASLPPLALARGYAVFANGGFQVEPYLVAQVQDRNGVVVQQTHPLLACRDCEERLLEDSGMRNGQDSFDLSVAGSAPLPQPAAAGETMGPPERFLAPRAVDERTTYLVQSLLRDVVRRGTGRGALVLERGDLAGKTGTTNDFRDAWFSGFGGGIVATTWVGMDDFSSLGRGEFAAKAALPMWVAFMREALEGRDEADPRLPNGLVTALIDPSSGRLAPPGTPGAMSELFKVEDLSRLERHSDAASTASQREAFDIF